ncbi:MAG: aminoglycoside 6-adenylyltransferase [Alphaproteobacteria bacterium]|nr:aminoglycoside 6-adenylyltransferase [Alphaproteobacteria bacterium]
MRNEEDMLRLIMETAKNDVRIRAVIMNGSRVNIKLQKDIFQDFDIVYFVTAVEPFMETPRWIDCFGERMILQTPDTMLNSPPKRDGGFTYLMQFTDGNRIDLSLVPVSQINERKNGSLSTLLLDKDGLFRPFASPSDRDYLPETPTNRMFADCCNEFWWVSTYVAKGLWREEITYARHMLDCLMREQMMKMLGWHIGVNTGFSCNPGAFGKHMKKYLEPPLWELLQKTYSDANFDNMWDALETMCVLFRTAAKRVAAHFSIEYPQSEDRNVSSHLRHVRFLPKDATEIY